MNLLKFFINTMMEIGTLHGFIEGTLIDPRQIDKFAEKLVEKFLKTTAGEMNLIIMNISNFKSIFIQAL
jgi:hypothetical protein